MNENIQEDAIKGRAIARGLLYSHSTAQAAWLWATAVGLGLLGNDERLFTGVGVQSVDGVVRVVGQGAAVPHRGLSYIQDLIAHRLLRTSSCGRSGRRRRRRRGKGKGGKERGRGEVGQGGEELKEGKDGRRGQEGSPVSSKTAGEVIR